MHSLKKYFQLAMRQKDAKLVHSHQEYKKLKIRKHFPHRAYYEKTYINIKEKGKPSATIKHSSQCS